MLQPFTSSWAWSLSQDYIPIRYFSNWKLLWMDVFWISLYFIYCSNCSRFSQFIFSRLYFDYSQGSKPFYNTSNWDQKSNSLSNKDILVNNWSSNPYISSQAQSNENSWRTWTDFKWSRVKRITAKFCSVNFLYKNTFPSSIKNFEVY